MTDNPDLALRREQVRARYGVSDLEPQAEAPSVNPEEIAGGIVEERFYYATQWQLMWWRFRRHRMALISGVLLIGLYLMAIFADLIAPYDASDRFRGYQQAPPSQIHWFDETGLRLPFVYGLERQIQKVMLVR